MFKPTLAANIHSNVNLGKKITIFFAIVMMPIFLLMNKIAPPYTSPYLAQNHLSDWLWVPLLSLEESLSITTGRCDLGIATHARKMHKKISI